MTYDESNVLRVIAVHRVTMAAQDIAAGVTLDEFMAARARLRAEGLLHTNGTITPNGAARLRAWAPRHREDAARRFVS